MRFIRKGAEPDRLSAWKQENRDTPHVLRYSNLPTPVKQQIRDRMMAEQGSLCAYTMSRIGRPIRRGGPDDFHIEHVQAQAHHPDREVDFNNMVLCAPGDGAARCGYGAQQKGDADVNDENFVSPLVRSCEERLSYRISGEVHVANETDEAARRTINLLGLNHPTLVESRSEAFRSHGLGPSALRPISVAKATRLAEIITKADRLDQIAPYCIAIRQVAERFAKRRKARAARIARPADL